METSPATSVPVETILEIINKAQQTARHVYLIQDASYGRALLQSRFEELPKAVLQEKIDMFPELLLIALPEEKNFFPGFLF